MANWNALLIVIVSVFLAALLWSLYRTLKSIYKADSLILDKALKQNDLHLNSFSIAPSHYLKRRFSQPQRDFCDSFIELSKEQPSTKIASHSTSTLIHKEPGAEHMQKSDRSMDFLLFATTRRAAVHGIKGAIDLDSSFQKIKNDLEKPSSGHTEVKDEINQMEKDLSSKSRYELFRCEIWNELKNYHYIFAVLWGKSGRNKPLRHHASHNSAFYLILIFVLTLAASIIGPEKVNNIDLIIVGCAALIVLIPAMIYCYQNTEEDTCLVEYLLAQKTPEDSIEDKTINYITQAQQQIGKNTASLFFHILGLAGGIAAISKVQRLEVPIDAPFLTSLLLVVALDILVVRNLVVTVMTYAAPSGLKKRVIKNHIRLLLKSKSETGVVAIEAASGKKPSLKEDHPRILDNSEIRPTSLVLASFRGTKEPFDIHEHNKTILPSILTTINDLEGNRTKRQRTMSFSEKDRIENLLKTQVDEVPELKANENAPSSIEDLEVNKKLSGMKFMNHYPLQGINGQPEDVFGIDTQLQDKASRRIRRLSWKKKFYDQKTIEVPEQSVETSPIPQSNEDKIKTPKEFSSSMRFFEDLEAVLNTSLDKKTQKTQREASPPKEFKIDLPQYSYQELHSRSNTESQVASKTDIHQPRFNIGESSSHNLLQVHVKSSHGSTYFGGHKSSVVNSGTTLASLPKDLSKHRSSIENIHGEKPSLTGTPRSFTPSIANFDHDKTVGKTFNEFGSVYSRLSAGDSQIEFKDIENLKHLPKLTEGVTESDLGDFDNSKYEYKLSAREFSRANRDLTLRPIQENGYVIRDRNKRQITENDTEESLEVTDLAYKGGKVIGDETDHKRRRVVQRVPLRARYESAEKPKIRKLCQPAGYIDSKTNFDKLSDVPKGYGYNFGFNASKDVGMSQAKRRKCSSMEREDDDPIRLPKLNKTNNQGGDRIGEKKFIQSLNKVPSFPELKGSSIARSQVIM